MIKFIIRSENRENLSFCLSRFSFDTVRTRVDQNKLSKKYSIVTSIEQWSFECQLEPAIRALVRYILSIESYEDSQTSFHFSIKLS